LTYSGDSIQKAFGPTLTKNKLIFIAENQSWLEKAANLSKNQSIFRLETIYGKAYFLHP
jgi:hypothetical protein